MHKRPHLLFYGISLLQRCKVSKTRQTNKNLRIFEFKMKILRSKNRGARPVRSLLLTVLFISWWGQAQCRLHLYVCCTAMSFFPVCFHGFPALCVSLKKWLNSLNHLCFLFCQQKNAKANSPTAGTTKRQIME